MFLLSNTEDNKYVIIAKSHDVSISSGNEMIMKNKIMQKK